MLCRTNGNGVRTQRGEAPSDFPIMPVFKPELHLPLYEDQFLKLFTLNV